MPRVTIKKLICDRCGKELTDRDDILLALEGAEAWRNACRARGIEPRGLFPCENYRHCGGEMSDSKSKGIFSRGGRTD